MGRGLEMSLRTKASSPKIWETRRLNGTDKFSELGKINHHNGMKFLMKGVVQLSTSLEYINKFESIASASRRTGISASNISMRCNGVIKFKTKKFM